MQKYITQLLTDLKAAQKDKPEKVDYKLLHPDHPAASPEYKGYLDYIIEWETAPEWKMDDLFGIKGDAFPPLEKLNDEQINQLVDGILELWASFNIDAVILDDRISARMIYPVLVNHWKTETIQYISEGTLHLEFCHYVEESCPWGSEYCTCKELDIEPFDETNNKSNPNIQDSEGDDLPF
jgi:hypothetical protein